MPKLTNEEIDKVRSEHKAECREQFYQAASKGFLTWGSVAFVANAILHYTCKFSEYIRSYFRSF